MSAIFGLVHWDRRPVAEDGLARMDEALAPYGVDGGGLWRDGHIGLGHRLSVLTPEDRFERQPVVRGEGQGALVADARVDNRDELARAWPSGGEPSRGPDSAYIWRALETWGGDAAGRLRGAFAFAHWDAKAERLILARSPFCERPLFYHSSARSFAFASMPRALFALGLVDRAIDEPFLADFLAVQRPDPAGSFFRHVRRVPGGHVLTVTAAGARLHAFWRPDQIRELRLGSDDEYVEAFLEVYARAVRDALRSAGPIGVMMSGGLDSSSVAAMAAPVLAARGARLAAFTEVPAENFAGPMPLHRYADETPYVRSIAQHYDNIDLTFIRLDDRWLFEHAEERYRAAEAPLRVAINMSWWDRLMAAAGQQGIRVLLHGTSGNVTISYDGAGLLAQLAARGRWGELFREARALARANGGASVLRTVLGGLVPLLPAWMYLPVQQLRAPAASARRPWTAFAAINPAFAAEQRVIQRARAMGPDPRMRQTRDTRTPRALVLPRLGALLDGQFAGCGARFGVDLRDPTADTRVVELCLSLPEDQFQRNGQPRWLIRRAMADRLPPDVVRNRRRGLQTADWFPRLLHHRTRLFGEIDRLERCDLARRAIDLPRLRRLVDDLPNIDAAQPAAVASYRGVLDLGLEAGRFILWAEAAERPSRPS